MHADFQELLSLRAGEPVAAEVAQHVSKCPKCGLELGRLQQRAHDLRQLPQLEPPARAWLAIQAQLVDGPNSRRIGWVYTTAAAASVVIMSLAVLWSMGVGRGASSNVAANTAPSTLDAGGGKESIGQLVTRSQQLEALLQRLPQRPVVERAETSATIDELQTSIQLLDLQLSNVNKNDTDQEKEKRLWSTRVQLLDSLVYVRYAEVARGGRPMNVTDTGAI